MDKYKEQITGSLYTKLHDVEISPEMHGNEIQALYNRHHKVSPNPNPHLNASNSVKHEVI